MNKMKWSLQQLFRYSQTPLEFNEEVDYHEYIKNISDILDMSIVKVKGSALHLYDDRYSFDLNIKCKLVLEDAVTLDPIDFVVDLNVTETFDKKVDFEVDDDTRLIEKNTIDLYDIVWENILLTKPIKVTKNM